MYMEGIKNLLKVKYSFLIKILSLAALICASISCITSIWYFIRNIIGRFVYEYYYIDLLTPISLLLPCVLLFIFVIKSNDKFQPTIVFSAVSALFDFQTY